MIDEPIGPKPIGPKPIGQKLKSSDLYKPVVASHRTKIVIPSGNGNDNDDADIHPA